MPKARNLLITNVFVLSLAVPAGLAGDDVVERTFDFASGGLLDIDTERGSIEIRTGNTGQVRVRIEASRGSVSDYVEVRFDDRNGLRIEAEEIRGARDRGGVHFRIEAPEDMNLRIRTEGGHVEVDDVIGEVAIRTGGGHIEFGDVGGTLTIDTGGGHIEGGEIGSHGNIRTGGGHIEVGDTMGDLEVRSGGGHIEVGDVEGLLQVRTGGGHLGAGHVMGNAELRSGGGHVGVEACDGDVEVNTGGGEIELREVAGFVYAHTGGGDIEVSLAAGNTSGVDLRSEDDGDIVVKVPSGHGFDVDAIASGRVDADASLGFSGKREADRLSGSIGGGGGVLKIRAEDGDIQILAG